MRLLRTVFAVALTATALGACAKPVSQNALATGPVKAQDAVAASAQDTIVTGGIASSVSASYTQSMPRRIFHGTSLAGRTLEVGSAADIQLKPGEVILTFDDGPRPGKTEHILDTLEAHGVKATFLMLGSQAKAHPELAREVALRGNTVGNHTYDHADLAKMSRQDAMDDIARGATAIATVLDGAGGGLSPFFRFPYLAQTGFLRTSMLQGDVVVLDVDIDSKDYYAETADEVIQRTLKRLDARGSGIILFHDIHQRTVDLLPVFLDEIAARGYTVVSLKPRTPGVFGRSVVTASVAGVETDQPAPF